jgi:hypothetical protein
VINNDGKPDYIAKIIKYGKENQFAYILHINIIQARLPLINHLLKLVIYHETTAQ